MLFIVRVFIACLLILTSPVRADHSTHELITELERSYGGRLGVYAINLADNSILQYRAQERFPFQSTFKALGVAAILKASMHDSHYLKEKIRYKPEDLVAWSPITKQHLSTGMNIFDLCKATLIYSDNTAINLLMKKLGGRSVVEAFAHTIGNKPFNITHDEPHLNSNPNSIQDTSTPESMGKSIRALAFGDVLAPAQREQLISWMSANKRGNNRIRAGVPKKWQVADKTGSGSFGITNDIGIIWPPKRQPIIIALYYVQKKEDAIPQERLLAEVTRLVVAEFSKR